MRADVIKLLIIWTVAFAMIEATCSYRVHAASFQERIAEYKAMVQRGKQHQQPQIRYVYPPRPPLQPNGSYYTDEQLRQSNMTRYNASGKQQVQRHIEAWRSPLQRFDGDEQPGVYSSGYLGPLPQGPTDGPYCPPGYNCFKIDRNNDRRYRP